MSARVKSRPEPKASVGSRSDRRCRIDRLTPDQIATLGDIAEVVITALNDTADA